MSRSAVGLRMQYVGFEVAHPPLATIARFSARGMGGRMTVVAAQALFLWMFFAADPLEQLATSGAAGTEPALRDAAFSFAAAWRHGMASNSPLYMPGFFAVALTTWLFAPLGRWRDRLRFLLGLAAATALALAAAPAGAASVVGMYHAQSGTRVHGIVPAPSAQAIFSGLYTLVTWTAFVVGCRTALDRWSLRPLLPVPVLTGGLVLVRPWTVDEFTHIWCQQVGAGSPVAIGSLLMIPVLGWFLASRSAAAISSRSPGDRL